MSALLKLEIALASSLVCACAAPLPQDLEADPSSVAATEEALGATDTVPRVASASSIVYRAETVIDGTPEEISDVITDLESYGEWNPWVFNAWGDTREGGLIEVDVKLGAISTHAKHVVLRGNSSTQFCWRDEGFTTLFVYGQRCRYMTLRPDGRTDYRVELLIEGPMARVFDHLSGHTLQDGVDEETPALAARVVELRDE